MEHEKEETIYYLYQGHHGSRYFATDYKISEENLECEACGDTDVFIGVYSTDEELKKILLSIHDEEEKVYNYISEIKIFKDF